MGPEHNDESRRYRILDVIGKGGFGKVYRARLEGAEGFAKDVAIKLLTDAEAPEEVLARFRDESRILGLVRDRAIVTVDPPTRLDGRWAVVMEFVDGANCKRLLKRSPIPPRVAVEIVQEVARALDNVYTQVGPDGEPLKLIHRDIKPANLQLTPAGSVKVLDFGIARADFGSREARTTTHIGGTVGYIAPERLHGIEGPEGDVYSLGVTLVAMLCGRRPTPSNRAKMAEWVKQDPDLQAVWDLAQDMQNHEIEERPTARQVEDRCLQLAPTLQPPLLRRWAEEEVTQVSLEGEDDLIGNVLTETMAYLPRLHEGSHLTQESATLALPKERRWMAAGLVTLVLTMTVSAALLAGIAVFLMTSNPPPETIVKTITVVEPAPAPEIVIAAPVREIVEDTDVAVAEIEAPPAPVRPRPVRPAPRPSPRPAPAPVPSKAKRLPVTLGSVPFGATVWIDGRTVGETPLAKMDLTVGSHSIKMKRGDEEITRRIEVGKREPVKYIWKGGEWLTFF